MSDSRDGIPVHPICRILDILVSWLQEELWDVVFRAVGFQDDGGDKDCEGDKSV